MSHAESLGTVLMPIDISSPEGSFGEMVDQQLFAKRERVEGWDCVAKNFYVGKLVDNHNDGSKKKKFINTKIREKGNERASVVVKRKKGIKFA